MAGSTLLDPIARSYAGALESLLRTVPEADAPVRSANMAAFLETGFPTKRMEDWRYTDLSTIAGNTFAQLPGADRDLSAQFLADTMRLVFVDGQAKPGQSDFDQALLTEPGVAEQVDSNGISQLNAALAVEGAHIRIPAGREVQQPLHVLCSCDGGESASMLHMRHSIHLERGAAATIIFEDLSPEGGSHLLTQNCKIELADGAKLELIRIQQHGSGMQQLSRWDVSVGRDAQLHWTNLDLGGALIRNDLNVVLAAPGADAELSGVYAPAGKTHIDNHTRIDHRQPHGRSRQRYRGIVDDRARAVFNGRIVVHPDASKTDSDQQIANLLLSPTAEVNAKPELQIDNDDVKCAHGATCGQLDADALYYLRSRGLPPDAARKLLLFSFADAVLGSVACEPARRRLRERLLERIPGGDSIREML